VLFGPGFSTSTARMLLGNESFLSDDWLSDNNMDIRTPFKGMHYNGLLSGVAKISASIPLT
jgi:hypothetical protein